MQLAGDIQLTENLCGVVYEMELDADFNVSRMEPVVAGHGYDAATEMCPVDSIANPVYTPEVSPQVGPMVMGALLIVFALSVVIMSAAAARAGSGVVYVYNWTEYIDPTLIGIDAEIGVTAGIGFVIEIDFSVVDKWVGIVNGVLIPFTLAAVWDNDLVIRCPWTIRRIGIRYRHGTIITARAAGLHKTLIVEIIFALPDENICGGH